MVLATWALWKREMVRFVRERGRVSGALGTPLLFWAVLGSGLGTSFRSGTSTGEDYLAFFFPGAMALMVLFTAIFSALSVITDRDAGFLQGVLASPAPRAAIVLSKVLGGTGLAVVQGAIMLTMARALGYPYTVVGMLGALGALALVAAWVTGLGFVIAWRFDSTQGFHAIVNLLLMPLWLLSGAVFPATGAAAWLRYAMAANPLTYGMATLRGALTGHADGMSLVVPLAVTVLTLAAVLTAGLLSLSPARRARAGQAR